MVTAANITAGFTSMVLAASGRFEGAVYLLVLAVALDMVDGRVARLLKATSEVGRQLDSFSDAGSFGLAPALLIYLAIFHELAAGGIVIAVVYVLAGSYRLVRYNLLSDAHSKASRTMGLPIPVAASYVMAMVLLRDRLPIWAAVAVVLLLAVGMASRLRLPELKGIGPVSAMLCIGILNFFAFLIWPNLYTVGWWTLWNVCTFVAARTEDRRLALETPAQR